MTHDIDVAGFEFSGLQQVQTLNTITEFMTPPNHPLNQPFGYQVEYLGAVLYFYLFDGAQRSGFQQFQGELSVSIATISEDIFRITIRETRQDWGPNVSGFQEVSIEGFHDRTTLPVSPVPLPAASWLLLSGLTVLGFLGRGIRS